MADDFDLPRPPAGRRAATRQAGPPSEATPVFSVNSLEISSEVSFSDASAQQGEGAEKPKRSTSARGGRKSTKTTRTPRTVRAKKTAPVAAEGAEEHAATEGRATEHRASEHRASEYEAAQVREDEPVAARRRRRVKENAQESAAQTYPEVFDDASIDEPTPTATVREIGSRKRTTRRTRRKVSTDDAKKLLDGIDEAVAVDSNGEVSTDSVLDALAPLVRPLDLAEVILPGSSLTTSITRLAQGHISGGEVIGA